VDIEKVEEIDKSEEARKSGWKELVIPEKYSQLLVSLVDNHTSGFAAKKGLSIGAGVPSVQIDLVRGKGRGLIILLHGPPGSGKTSTAETIASYCGRPLYSITCGDIGTTADEVEDRLLDHTELAERWNCVLLLDEADVFLMRRSWDDMERNALVSVFLRHLEYYSGILFLTTNIVGVIDEAFKSRIHVALRYPSIDLESTKKIWNNVLDRIERDNATADVRIEFNRATLLDFASAHYRRHEQTDSTWNGRQVRNAFQIAIALGQYERLTRIKDEGLDLDQALKSKNRSLTTVRLTKRNFLNIASTARDFEDYISSIRGSDSSVARANMHRDDDYGRGYQKAQKAYPARAEPQPPPERPQPQARAGAAAGRDPYETLTSGRPARPAAGSGGRRRAEEDMFEEGGLMDDEDDEFEAKDGRDEFEDE
jgi:SpoVK/Ycf46/Vps4 family AAA+-type ATPase